MRVEQDEHRNMKSPNLRDFLKFSLNLRRTTLRNTPEGRRFHQHRDGSLKSKSNTNRIL
jgi:hypothetical protein